MFLYPVERSGIESQGTVSMIHTKDAVTVVDTEHADPVVKANDTVSTVSLDTTVSAPVADFLRDGRLSFGSLSGYSFNVYFKSVRFCVFISLRHFISYKLGQLIY